MRRRDHSLWQMTKDVAMALAFAVCMIFAMFLNGEKPPKSR